MNRRRRRGKGPLLPRTIPTPLSEGRVPASDGTKEKSTHRRRQPLYGDAIMCVAGTASMIFYGVQTYSIWNSNDGDATRRRLAVQFLVLMTWPFLFYFPAALKRNLWCSRIGFLGEALIYCPWCNLVGYPHPSECLITPMYQGHVAISVLANVSLSFREKIARLGLLFVVGSYVSVASPYSIYIDDTLPVLGGTILVAIFLLYVYHFSIARVHATVQAARLFLAAFCLHYWLSNLPEPGTSAVEKYKSCVKIVCLMGVGVVATGAFRQEVLQKEHLEALVHKRTRKLHVVGMALRASETAIAITDKYGSIVWLNKAFETLCNKKEGKLIGRLVKDVIYHRDPSRKENKYVLMESYEDTASMATREAELRIGNSIYTHESTPFRDHHEGAAASPTENNRFLMAFKDITAARAREAAEQKAQDEAMMAKAMGESMVTLTHELRTPLQGIMGVASMLMQNNELGADAIESIKVIMASSSLLLNLINNLLDVKKATANMMEEFPLSPVLAAGPIEDAIVFSKPLASISDVKVSSDVALAPNAFVLSNSLRLQQVLINLVSNAIKYTARGSTITVKTYESTVSSTHAMMETALASSRDGTSTSAQDSTNQQQQQQQQQQPVLIVSVSDCGPGIEGHQASRLFQRYTQLDNQSSSSRSVAGSRKIGQPSGTGLGLHLCQMFVQRMNGHIWVTNNNHGSGSTFSFFLPLLSNELPSNNIANNNNVDAASTITIQGNQKRRRSSVSRLGDTSRLSLSNKEISLLQDDIDLVYNQRVLFVDDTLINRKVISRILAKVGFTNVTTVESGEAAMKELVIEKNYDLVISDLQMPGMSGTELSEAIARAASADDSFQWPVIIGLTADTSLDVAERCQASKMSDVLYKPITIGDMERYAENVLLSLQPGVWYDGNIEKDGLLFGSQPSLPVQ